VEIQGARKAGAQSLSDKQVSDIGRQIMGGCQGWARSFVRTSYWQSQATLAAVIIVVAAAAFGTGWWMHTPPSELACADQVDGSRLCWMYTRLPSAVPKR
jgi:hypothetical protein